MPLDAGGGTGVSTTAKTYSPSPSQLLSFTRISYSEQGNDIGAQAEMSLILNKFELAGKTGDATALYNWLYGNRWWHESADVMDGGSECNHPNPTDAEQQLILGVLQGKRTLPLYIDEHDFRGDIAYLENGNGSNINDNSCYVQHQTIIHNNMGSKYWFYCFPTDKSDPFGYTSQANREKFGDGIPAGGGSVGAVTTGSDSLFSGDMASGGIAGLEFSTKPVERETARVEEGDHEGLKTFYRVNMSGPQFIKQVLAPYCKAKETGQGGYRLWFADESSPDGSRGTKLYFKPDNYSNIEDKVSQNILKDIDREYQFSLGSGPTSSVLDFTPNYAGIVTSIMGGATVEGATTEAITNELLSTSYNRFSDKNRPSTGDSVYDDLQGIVRIGDSSYTYDEIAAKSANLWYNMSFYGYTADMTILGDPLLNPQTVCVVGVYTPMGLPHHSSGVYLIYHITDEIRGGTFTSQLSLVRNAIKIGTNDSGGLDITIGPDTKYIGEAAGLVGASPLQGSGNSGSTSLLSGGSNAANFSDTDYSDTVFVGDSMMAIRKSQLAAAFPGAEIKAKSGEPFSYILGQVQSIQGNVNRVVIGMGNNDWAGVSVDQANQLLGLLSGKHIYLIKMLVTNNKTSTNTTNQTIDTVARQNPNVHIIDWYGAVINNPGKYIKDNVHQSDDGFSLYVDLIRKAL